MSPSDLTRVALAMWTLALGCQTPLAVAQPVYAGLANITGYTQDQVKTVIGLPVVTKTRAGVTSWSYATPDGDRFIYFVNGHAMMTLPSKHTVAPAAVAGCVQAAEARTVIVLAENTPV